MKATLRHNQDFSVGKSAYRSPESREVEVVSEGMLCFSAMHEDNNPNSYIYQEFEW